MTKAEKARIYAEVESVIEAAEARKRAQEEAEWRTLSRDVWVDCVICAAPFRGPGLLCPICRAAQPERLAA